MGAVYYGFNHTFDKGGGHLHLINADFRDNPLEFDVVRKDEIVEISPDFNRVVIFNSSKWHKVTRVTGGKRYAFVSNANSHVPEVFTKQGKIGSA
jgi:Rps23 Pro-64 3,4-dihydroxylase Tpa1-like proline 4-hydroxylase